MIVTPVSLPFSLPTVHLVGVFLVLSMTPFSPKFSPIKKVSDGHQKWEGEGRESECPSRAFSPLYIGI